MGQMSNPSLAGMDTLQINGDDNDDVVKTEMTDNIIYDGSTL